MALCILACEGQSQEHSSVGRQEDHLENWLMQVIKWYDAKPESALLDMRWDKEEIAFMEGKQETISWLENSGYFTSSYLGTIKHYLNTCETETRKYPEADRFDCLDRDLLVANRLQKYESIDSLTIVADGEMRMVSFKLNGLDYGIGDDLVARSQWLKYRLATHDSTWQIDQTGSIDAKGNWEKHWIW